MATILRSLKYIRNLNISPGGRRLGTTSLQRFNGTRRLQIQPLASTSTQNRNYVIDVATNKNYNDQRVNIDVQLNELDENIKQRGYTRKKDMENLLENISIKGSLSSMQALLLIRCCGEFLSPESLATRQELLSTIWDTINQLNVELDVSHYNSLLLVNLYNETNFSPLNILLEMKNRNIEPNRVTYQRLIEQYCNMGDIAGATKILEHLSAQEIPINEIIFNSLIKGHSNSGDTESAINIMDIMKNSGIEPTSLSYSTILCMYAKTGNILEMRNVLNKCKEKDILLENKEILDIIYTLAINNHSEHVDEIITLLIKGSIYNKQAIPVIYKLIDKDCVDTAYKLLKTLVKSESMNNSGNFFIRKLITNNAKLETVNQYCEKLYREDIHENPFIPAIHCAFINDRHHLALPLFKSLRETGVIVKEHYFYPIFVSFTKANNLQGLLNTMKVMIFDFNIVPSISLLREYVIPYMLDSPLVNCKILQENNVPFSISANAMAHHLLQNNKTQQARSFITSTYFKFNPKMLISKLVQSLENTNDVQSFTEILHHQYVQFHAETDVRQKNEDNINNSNDFSSELLVRAAELLTKKPETIIDIIKILHAKGISINKQAGETIQRILDAALTTEINEVINDLVSGNLTLQPLNRKNRRKVYFEEQVLTLNRLKEANTTDVHSTIELMKCYAKLNNYKEFANLLEELNEKDVPNTIEFCCSIFHCYLKLDRLQEADKWFAKIYEINPEAKIDKAKILNYSILLTNEDRIDDAINVLNRSIKDVDEDRGKLCNDLLHVVKQKFPSRLQEIFHVLEEKKYFSTVSTQLLSHLIQAPLNSGDLTKALEVFKWSCEKYKLTPQRNAIMQKIIEEENAKLLQSVTDLCTKVHGEMNALFDLAMSFFNSNRPRQARKILETTGLRLKKAKIMFEAERLLNLNDAEMFEKYIKLLSGLIVDLDPLYVIMLQIYEKNNDWNKCLALWMQMQEDNIPPSSTFMAHLKSVLVKFNQEVPFTTSNSTECTDYCSIINICLQNNNVDEAVKTFITHISNHQTYIKMKDQPILTKLFLRIIETDNFNSIYKIMSNVNKNIIDMKRISYIVNSCYHELGKYNEFLTNLENLLDKPQNQYIVKKIFNGKIALKAMLENPAIEEKGKAFAFKTVNLNIPGPMSVYWILKVIKGSPEADQIWEQYLKNSNINAYELLVIHKHTIPLSKIPEFVQKLSEDINVASKNKKNELAKLLQFVVGSDDPNKYELAYTCLRCAAKSFDICSIDKDLITKIEQNIPKDLCIEALKTENDDRAHEKAIG